MSDFDYERPAWHAQAACRGATALFFPNRGENIRNQRHICDECPVRTQCLDQALAFGEHHGIWGGHTERERRRIRVANGNRPGGRNTFRVPA